MPSLVQLKPGSTVERWKIKKKLGQGGFGAVYLVTDSTGKYALKTESASAKTQLLKMEVCVLLELMTRGSRHFCKIEDRGTVGDVNYVVMTCVGKSLHDLRKKAHSQHFSLACALSVGLQSLEALEDLHSIGYLHRDVKPANYTIGREDVGELRKIYLLDFGMCRKFVNDDGTIRRPRKSAGFRGTVRYAPVSCHLRQDLCRRDDLETWIYMQVEMICGGLPWGRVNDMDEVGDMKKQCREDPNWLFARPCPRRVMTEILFYVDGIGYNECPDYTKIYNLLRQAIHQTGKTEQSSYDWENGHSLYSKTR